MLTENGSFSSTNVNDHIVRKILTNGSLRNWHERGTADFYLFSLMMSLVKDQKRDKKYNLSLTINFINLTTLVTITHR